MVRFGFGGSTGGSRNIHEIMCFQASPQNTSASSAGLNQKQTAKVQTGTQVYFAFYNANNWTGSLTSQYLALTGRRTTSVIIDPLVNWEPPAFSPVSPRWHLRSTGATGGSSGVPAQDPDAARAMITYNDRPRQASRSPGRAPASRRSRAEQSNLNAYDPSPASSPTWPMRRTCASSSCAACAPMSRTSRPRSELRRNGLDQSCGSGADRLSLTHQRARRHHRLEPDLGGSSGRSLPEDLERQLQSGHGHAGEQRSDLRDVSDLQRFAHERRVRRRQRRLPARIPDRILRCERQLRHQPNGAADNDGTEVLAFMPAYVVNSINTGATFQSATRVQAPPSRIAPAITPIRSMRTSSTSTARPGTAISSTTARGTPGSSADSARAAAPSMPSTSRTPASSPRHDPRPASAFTQSNAGSIVIGEWSS